ncbi:hypothetical protein ACHHYP_07280 [Achlya hypogyna]|uniref:Transmembrane protein n=1 Tax=Achlya hypogyna TaxID=1202772 RepID=A0A1V9YQZ2_ACHHY|nr:hypothetical protein ACHHYP_07280 [Achlya hypogyna]
MSIKVRPSPSHRVVLSEPLGPKYIPTGSRRWLYAIGGVGYVAVSLALGGYCLTMMHPYLENDFVWASFTSAHIDTVLANTFNLNLPLLPTPLDLLDPSSSVAFADTPGVQMGYPRLIMYQELTTLDAAVNGLRNLDVTSVNTMVSQYCWVDFKKRWAMAHTTNRQMRCRDQYSTNAAVYMEAVFRNIDYNAWVASTQGFFMQLIGNGVTESADGPDFLAYMEQHQMVDAASEVSVWTEHGLVEFVLQYANMYQIGLREDIQITNALGLARPLRIKTIASTNRGTLWTTDYMYASLAADLHLIFNVSLVQNASNFFSYMGDDLLEQLFVCTPLTPLFQVVHDQIGPLVTIDVQWVPIPVELSIVVNRFRTLILEALTTDSSVGASLAAIGAYAMRPTPLQWQNSSLLFYGGNPTCGFSVGLSFVQESFGFDDACASQTPLSIRWSPFESLFASAMAPASIDVACQLVPLTEFASCQQLSAATASARALLPSLSRLQVPITVQTLPLAVMQFVGTNGTIALETQRLLEPSFAFWGWTAVYEWALNKREVVSFEGDAGRVMLMSYAAPPQPLPTHSIDSSFGIYLWYCSAIVSIALFGIGTLVVGYWMYLRTPDCPWFFFNRITSSTWLNRSLLLVRGLSAVVCLASAIVVPTATPLGVRFENAPRSLFASFLLAGEVTWLTYVLHETLHPLTGALTVVYAPWSSALVWLVLVCLDVATPVTIKTSTNRTCFSRNMDQMIYCSSGHVTIGSWQRTVVQLAVVALGIAGTYIVVWRRRRLMHGGVNDPEPSLLLTSAAAAFLHPNELAPGAATNAVVAAMCGILYLPRMGFFDTNLWMPLPADACSLADRTLHLDRVGPVSDHGVSPTVACFERSAARSSSNKFRARVSFVTILGGIGYTIVSLFSNVAFLAVAQSFLANDYGWSAFNSTGMHAFLANTFNSQLLMATHQTLDFSNAAYADITRLYNATVTPITWSANAPRRELVDPGVPLESIVRGLRDMDPCKLPWLATQYCWLDFNRVWSMASTAARQRRCAAKAENGAVYLEAPLRNVNNWATWRWCWGQSYDTAIVASLRSSHQGLVWLAAVESNTNSIEQETAHWLAQGVHRFELQWQNYKTMGMTDTFTITSALGFTTPLTLVRSAGSYHVLQQTSMRMYWTLASDLWAVVTNTTLASGHSLVASSPRFAFGNVSTEALLFQNLTLLAPLSPGLLVLRSALGPFGAVDMRVVECPATLKALYEDFTQRLHTLLISNEDAQSMFYSIPPKPRVCAVPPYFLSDMSLMANGGNLMCGNDVPDEPAFLGMLSGFGAFSTCHALFLEATAPSTASLVFAVVGLNATHSPIVKGNGPDICVIDQCSGASCVVDFNTTLAFFDGFASAFVPLYTAAVAAATDVLALSIHTIQYYTAMSDNDTKLYQINLLEPMEPFWTFYGWCYLYEWLTGVREVVTFEGDNGVISALTLGAQPISASPDPAEISVSFSTIFLGCTFYITWLLICVAGVVTVYFVGHKGNVEGNNLYEINRIVGHVWAGRTFLMIRSVTAIWILNTAPLLLEQVGQVTHLISPQRPWYQTVLAASEVTWLVYALNDVLSCLTQQHTAYYAYKSSLGTWVVVVVWSFLSPLTYTASLDRSCAFVDMDFELVCTSAAIGIGSTKGVGGVVGIAVGSVLFWSTLERLRHPGRPQLQVRSLLLNAQSLYMLDFANWTLNGKYFLDKTSAVLAGLLSIQYKDNLYILDIKTWRVFAVTPATPVELLDEASFERLHWAIPLSQI